MGMQQEVYMEPDRVRMIARAFTGFSVILKAVNTVLEAQMMILKGSAFCGLVGAAAVERHIASIQPCVERLSQKCAELGEEVEVSVKKWEQATNRS
jgi:hypothetical protein